MVLRYILDFRWHMKIDKLLDVTDNHKIAIYRRGNPQGKKVIFLHGGPGGSISEKSFDFFDLDKWDVYAFDQRGCGQSEPFASLENNTVFHSIEDMEAIRKYYEIDSWTVFGGSYGSTLALVYGIHYPKRVEALVLRGIFLGRKEDIAWLYQDGASYFYPEVFETFRSFIDEEQRDDLVKAYYEIFLADGDKKYQAAKIWADWENSIVNLVAKPLASKEVTDDDISLALLECHYFANQMHWTDDNYILNRIDKIKEIPTYIVHGRYDVDCRPIGAYDLARKLDKVHLYITDKAGHSPYEETSFKKLVEIMNSL